MKDHPLINKLWELTEKSQSSDPVTSADVRLLIFVYRHQRQDDWTGPYSLIELAGELGVSRSTVAASVKRLKKAGILESPGVRGQKNTYRLANIGEARRTGIKRIRRLQFNLRKQVR